MKPAARKGRWPMVAWWFLLLAMWGVLLCWAVIFWWYNYYLDDMVSFSENVSTPLTERANTDWFDGYEMTVIIFTLPSLLIATLAALYFSLPTTPLTARWPISQVWSSVVSFPLVLPAPLPVINLAELLCYTFMACTCAWGTWMWFTWGYDDAELLYKEGTLKTTRLKSLWALEKNSGTLGWVSFWPFWLLFYPVTRRSVLLQIMGIQYEQAVVFHRWLAHAALFLAIVHSVLMYVAWAMAGKFYQTWEWARNGYSYIAGSICFVIAIIIWVTSLNVFRRKYFEVFYYTHHLFLLYIIFYWLHVGPWAIFWCVVPLGLYFLDRILRFLQTRHQVKLINPSVLSSGYISFQVPSSTAIKYPHSALIFITVPSISRIESHPFSIINISATSPDVMTILAKPSGNWTNKFRDLAPADLRELTAQVEGPYYPARSNLLHRYDALILVAGGSGITSFMSLLQDLLHRHQHCTNEEARSALPSHVTLIWTVRQASELEVLDECMFESYGKHVNFNVLLFVTEKEGEKQHIASVPGILPRKAIQGEDKSGVCSYAPIAPRIGGQSWLLELFLMMSVVLGSLFTIALFYRAIVYPYEDHMPGMEHEGGHDHDGSTGPVYSTYGKVLLYSFAQGLGIVVSTAVAVMAIIAFQSWYTGPFLPSEGRQLLSSHTENGCAVETREEGKVERMISSLRDVAKVSHNGRPNWQDTLDEVLKDLAKFTCVGVLVSGPKSMERALAWECQRRSFFNRARPFLRYHRYSFTL